MQRKTSPFVTLWYGRLDSSLQGAAFKWMARGEGRDETGQSSIMALLHVGVMGLICFIGALPQLALTMTSRELPDKFKDSSDRTRRKQRKSNRKQDPKAKQSDAKRTADSI